jgi:thiol-disulfide isomerase/thioredoxin
LNEFQRILNDNTGLIFIKYEAEWCVPCQKIKQPLLNLYDQMPDNVKRYVVDVDESFELYAFLKNKKMIKGIPAIHCYKAGNTSYIPDEMFFGSSIPDMNLFFNTCITSLYKNNATA